MTIERTETEVIVRLSPSLDIEELQRVLNYLTYKEATADSLALQADVDTLTKEIKKDRRQRSKEQVNK